MKIDLHTHILPERWPDLEERYGYAGFIRLDHHKPCCARMMMGDRFFREIDHNCWSPGRRMEECDEHPAGAGTTGVSKIAAEFVQIV